MTTTPTGHRYCSPVPPVTELARRRGDRTDDEPEVRPSEESRAWHGAEPHVWHGEEAHVWQGEVQIWQDDWDDEWSDDWWQDTG